MIKIFCDRCGKEIVNLKPEYRMILSEKGRTYEKPINDISLCWNCYQSFNEWLKAEIAETDEIDETENTKDADELIEKILDAYYDFN